MGARRTQNVLRIGDKIPSGDLRQGFVYRDTGTRKVILIHPASAIEELTQKLNTKGDVYVHQLIPPNTAYFIDRENWTDMERELDESVVELRRGGRT